MRTGTGAGSTRETRPGLFVLLSLCTYRLHSMRYNILYIIMHAPGAVAHEYNDSSAEGTTLRSRRTALLALSATHARASTSSRTRRG